MQPNPSPSDRFETVLDPLLGERVLLATSTTGLHLRVVPTDRFKETTAIISFAYGSTDLGFDDARTGARHASPEGVAHYLEHKLFEAEDLHVFERFGSRGADVNAMTSFAKTSYYFTAVSQWQENLRDLLALTATPHLTDENVEKERGIIAQEIRMYEDNPDYRAFFDLLGCLYSEHPVRHPVGGTVESIAAIDVAELLTCHATFYRTGNACLAIAGPVDADEVLAIADAATLPEGPAARSLYPTDLGPPARSRFERQFPVARPRVMLGFKEAALLDDADARADRSLASRVLLDVLFGGSSERRDELRRRGDVDDSLSASYLGERSFGFAVLGCESDEPDRAADALRSVVCDPDLTGLDDVALERVRRKMIGGYVRSFDSVRGMAFAHADAGLDRLRPFRGLERMQRLTVDAVRARREELFGDGGAAAVSVLAPAAP
jgi:predicted Zn-dependent peptidase